MIQFVPLAIGVTALFTGHSIEASILVAAWYLGEVMKGEDVVV